MSATPKQIEIIDLLPSELVARLASDKYFSDIVVVAADEGDVEAMVNAKQSIAAGKGGKIGVAVIVLQIVGDDEQTGIQFGPMTLHPAFQVIEQRELNIGENGTKKPARQVARRIVQLVKGFGLVGLITDMKCSKPCIIPLPQNEIGKNVKAYEVDFNCLEWADRTPFQVATPQISAGPDANMFQIACSTVSAVVYFTTDGSYPWSGNPDAGVYTSPVPFVAPGANVRACAYLPSNDAAIASHVQKLNVPFNS